MTHFEDCLKRNNLDSMLEEQYGEYGHFTQENADLILKVAGWEDRYGAVPQLAAMISVTWCNESTFNFFPLPNVNCSCKKQRWPHDTPECNKNVFSPWKWDIGAMQMNLMWTHRMAWQDELSTKGTLWVDVFGTSFYEPDGRPRPFNGKTLPHMVISTRRLLGVKGKHEELGYASRQEMQVVKYTGPDAQEHRQRNWRRYDPLWREFFQLYTEGK